MNNEKGTEHDRFLEECISDPSLRDKMAILSRTFQNRKRVSGSNNALQILLTAIPLKVIRGVTTPLKKFCGWVVRKKLRLLGWVVQRFMQFCGWVALSDTHTL